MRDIIVKKIGKIWTGKLQHDEIGRDDRECQADILERTSEITCSSF